MPGGLLYSMLFVSSLLKTTVDPAQVRASSRCLLPYYVLKRTKSSGCTQALRVALATPTPNTNVASDGCGRKTPTVIVPGCFDLCSALAPQPCTSVILSATPTPTRHGVPDHGMQSTTVEKLECPRKISLALQAPCVIAAARATCGMRMDTQGSMELNAIYFRFGTIAGGVPRRSNQRPCSVGRCGAKHARGRPFAPSLGGHDLGEQQHARCR